MLKRFQNEAPKAWKKQVELHKKFFSDTSGVTINSNQKVVRKGKVTQLDEYQEKRIRSNYRQIAAFGRCHAPRCLLLKKSGHLALATFNKRVHLYDLETGNLVRTIDPFKLGFRLNCAAAIMFGLWCIMWLRLAASVHPYGWIDSSVCIGL